MTLNNNKKLGLFWFRYRGKFLREEGYNARIKLRWTHNHPLSGADVLKQRDVSEETKEKIINLFKEGHQPGK